MLKKGDKVRQIAGRQPGTYVGEEYEVVAAHGDSRLTLEGDIDDGVCNENEFFLKDNDGDIRYQIYPKDSFTKWEKVE